PVDRQRPSASARHPRPPPQSQGWQSLQLPWPGSATPRPVRRHHGNERDGQRGAQFGDCVRMVQAWQNYIEAQFSTQRRMADWHFGQAKDWDELLRVHDQWVVDFNFQVHWAHRQREDGR
ncbi:MAG: hypothetical protein M3Q29_09130, partial [Chloroflexota bacterium]|nr:hypothetical protein [Chloroflexota bacterium]